MVRANAQHLAQMAAMRQAKRAAQTTAKAGAIQAAGVCAPRRPTESPVPMAAMQRDVLAVISNAKMVATSMEPVHAQAAANMDATTTAHASPTPLDARMASIKIAAIACARIPAPMGVIQKAKYAIARMPVRAAVTRPARNVAVRQVAPMDHHATTKLGDAHVLAHVQMDAKKMAHATKHAKPYNAKAKMNNVKTAHV